MTIFEFRKLAQQQLHVLYESAEAYRMIDILLEEYLSYSAAMLHAQRSRMLDSKEQDYLFVALEKMKHGMPIQYVLGKAWFFDLHILVNESTLIPRPETEELVNWVVEENLNRDDMRILDIGTGSGCIALALKKFLPFHAITASDISQKAIAIAEKNASLNKLDITFIESDILHQPQDKLHGPFDIIVSNPPYIRKSEAVDMHKNVLDFEPHLALFVEDENPLRFYEAIAEFAIQNSKDVILYMEMNEGLGTLLKDMLAQKGYRDIVIKKDLFGKQRMMRAKWRAS